VRDLRQMLELSPERDWTPPIVQTIATEGTGIDDLHDAIAAHRAHLEADGRLAQRRGARLREELRAIVLARLAERAGAVSDDDAFEALARRVDARELDPYAAADELLASAG